MDSTDVSHNQRPTTALSHVENHKQSFIESLKNCVANRSKYERWTRAIEVLESDPVFEAAKIKKLVNLNSSKEQSNCEKTFGRLSSGHKIVLLTITRLVESVEEKTLVLLDEPETHLHPPLLSSFIRALSELLINRNGVAILTTHSPVVLQEVSKDCVWKLSRFGSLSKAERPTIETYGENVSRLISEVFELEVTRSGFH
ncbi:MAG: ATP-binding protein, partial [Firmicutes bacterium]|nr:ATP-binding protein [Bacillota bacterium]